PSKPFIGSMLHNPCYAGAYVWGQRPMALRVVEGKLTTRPGPWQRPEDGRVFLPNHHDGSMDWATFEEHRRIMHNTTTKPDPDEAAGAVHAGKAPLAGLRRGGHRGRKTEVGHRGASRTTPAPWSQG